MAAIDFAKASAAQLQANGYSFSKLPAAGPAELEEIHGIKLAWADGQIPQPLGELSPVEAEIKEAAEYLEDLLQVFSGSEEEEAWESADLDYSKV